MARYLGTPLISWQAHVADVATERNDDGSYKYQVVVVSVPRQAGKTTLLHAVGVHRALILGRDVYYTAQSGKDARKRWMDLVTALQESKMWRERVKVALRGGSEAVTFPGGATYNVFAPTPHSLHGYTPPCVFIDEAFHQSEQSGELLMGAISPAQLTIVDKQIWIVSTMGTAESTFFHSWVDKAIEGTPGVAGFIWGARDDQDPYSLDDIAAYHPGVGFDFNGKILAASDVLAEADRNSRAEYERAFANRKTITSSHLIPLEQWVRLNDITTPPEDLVDEIPAGCVLTYDVAADQAGSSLVATWKTNGQPHAAVLAADQGVAWLADAVETYRDLLRPQATAAAENGPVVEVTSRLRGRGHDIRGVTEREFVAATTGLLTHITEGTIHHNGADQGDDVLSRSIAGLVTRAGAVDGVAFSRKHSIGDSSAGIAAALGAWLVDQIPDTKPFTVFATT